MMKYPIVINRGNSIIIGKDDFFNGIGNLDMANNVLDINIGPRGVASLKWILDFEGCFYELAYQSQLPTSLLQRVGLSRGRERYTVSPGRAISVGELASLLEQMFDESEDLPNVADMKSSLAKLSPDHIFTSKDMKAYMNVPDD